MKNVDLTMIHYLSGPFEIEDAEPGDVLLVEIMDVQPFPDQNWGFTGSLPHKNPHSHIYDLLQVYLTRATAVDFLTRSIPQRECFLSCSSGLVIPVAKTFTMGFINSSRI